MTAYEGEEWNEARKAAMARDNALCQCCGTDSDLHAHHIKPVREFDNPQDAHYVENLVMLCPSCHRHWEGVREKPVLADAEVGVTVNEIAGKLTLDTLVRETFSAALPEIFWRYLVCNPANCSICFRNIDGPEIRIPWANYLKTLSSVVDLHPLRVSGVHRNENATPALSYCEKCANSRDMERGSPHQNRRMEMVDRIRHDLDAVNLTYDIVELRERYGYLDFPEVYRGPWYQGLQCALSYTVSGKYTIPSSNDVETYVPDYEERWINRDKPKEKEYLDWLEDEGLAEE